MACKPRRRRSETALRPRRRWSARRTCRSRGGPHSHRRPDRSSRSLAHTFEADTCHRRLSAPRRRLVKFLHRLDTAHRPPRRRSSIHLAGSSRRRSTQRTSRCMSLTPGSVLPGRSSHSPRGSSCDPDCRDLLPAGSGSGPGGNSRCSTGRGVCSGSSWGRRFRRDPRSSPRGVGGAGHFAWPARRKLRPGPAMAWRRRGPGCQRGAVAARTGGSPRR